MALRHLYPGVGAGLEPKRELRIPARVRPPRVVEFRRGCSMSNVVAEMRSAQIVHLDAAVGAGKSTVFPHVYAKETRSLVFHLVPNELLALDLYNRAVSTSEERNDTPIDHLVDVSARLPRSGVVYMSCAMFVAKLLHDGGNLTAYGEVTVFLDEAHESDAYTHCVRTLAIELGAMRLIYASATLSPRGVRPRETPGTLVEKRYSSSENPSTWDVMDPTKPWHYAGISNNCLMFVDSNSQAQRIIQSYRRLGFEAFRLQCGMAPDRFLTAVKALRDKRGPLVVLVADYSFRSGFTFDVDLVIDSGSVAFYDPTPGEPRRLNRPIYYSESVQAAGRAGRIREGTVTYWRPDFEPKRVICDLEGVEAEAAAYLVRCFGFSASAELERAVMASAHLPSDVRVADALNGNYPLTYYVLGEDGTVRSDLLQPRDSIDASRSSRPQSASSKRSDESATVVGEEIKLPFKASPTTNMVSPTDLLYYGDDEELVVGNFYLVPGIAVSGEPTVHFPDGVRSVRRFLGRTDGHLAVSGLAKTARRSAIGMVLARYNLLNVECAAVERFVTDLQRTGVRDLKGNLRQHVMAVLEELGGYNAEAKELLSCLQLLVYRQFEVKSVSPFAELIETRVSERMEVYQKILRKNAFDEDAAAAAARETLKSLAVSSVREIDYKERPTHLIGHRSHNDQVLRHRDKITIRTRTYYSVKPEVDKQLVFMTCGWRDRLHGYKPGVHQVTSK